MRRLMLVTEAALRMVRGVRMWAGATLMTHVTHAIVRVLMSAPTLQLPLNQLHIPLQ